MRRRSERGQVAPLIAVILVCGGFFCLIVARFGVAAAARAEARTSADAVALAGAAGGRPAADEIAAANSAAIVRYEVSGRDVKVRARWADAAASAKARREDGHARDGLAPAMRAVLARAAQLIGRQPRVLRVRDRGLTVVLHRDDAARLGDTATEAGLCGEGNDTFTVCPAPSGGAP
jgi:hypothetical protein